MGKKVPVKYLLNPIHFLSLGFGSGLFPRFPGTVGTLAAIAVYFPMQYLPWYWYLGCVLLFFVCGVGLCSYTAKALGEHDHGAIVWDEIVGYLLTMFMAPSGWLWILIGFVLFRIFDILKPWPISWFDQHVHGGVGIMLDDVIAAIFALFFIQIIVYLL